MWIDIVEDDAHTVGRWLTDRAAASPRRIAIDDRGVTIDYATLAFRATSLAESLRDAGYGPGDRVATVSGNSTDHVVAFFASALAGVAFVPLSWRSTPRELVACTRPIAARPRPRRGGVRLPRERGAARRLRHAARRRARHDGDRGVRPAVAVAAHTATRAR